MKGLVRIFLLIVAIVSLLGCEDAASIQVPVVDHIEFQDHEPVA
jgi:hypothetical protein